MAKPFMRLTPRTLDILYHVLGGLIFLAVFCYRYHFIDPSWYTVRDDGVITMSHARNLVDYGFIGINPSGERVEGYSAPLQFFIYAVAYAVSGIDYIQFARIQTYACTFLLGMVFIALFRTEKPATRLTASLFAAVMLSLNVQFLLWHGSGMENPVTNLLFAAVTALLFRALEEKHIEWWYAAPLFLASISRVESIYYILPLLVLFSLFWIYRYRSYRPIQLTGIVLAAWGLFNLWRYWYFGSFTPNTAPAKDIFVLQRILNWRQSLREVGWVYHGILNQNSVFVLFGFAALAALKEWKKKNKKHSASQIAFWFMVTTAFLMTLMAVSSIFTFGIDSMLGPLRITTHLAVFITLACTALLFYRSSRKTLWSAIPLVALCLWMGNYLGVAKPTFVGYPASYTDKTYAHLSQSSKREHLVRPTVATTDIGSFTWRKGFNVIDLAYLGSPFLAHAKNDDGVKSRFFFQYLAPDLLETHGYWSCQHYTAILTHPLFAAHYHQMTGVPSTHPNCMQIHGFWIRKDILRNSGTRERTFITELQADLTTERVAAEMRLCLASGKGCEYVVRAVYRLLPEFRERRLEGELGKLFVGTPVELFASYVINGHKDALLYREMIQSIRSQVGQRSFIKPENILKVPSVRTELIID